MAKPLSHGLQPDQSMDLLRSSLTRWLKSDVQNVSLAFLSLDPKDFHERQGSSENLSDGDLGVVFSVFLFIIGAAMTNPFDDENGEFVVLVNEELQYSLWPTFRDIPSGWKSVGPRGKRDDCLEYIEKNWTDMRPKSLVEKMNREAAAREQDTPTSSEPN